MTARAVTYMHRQAKLPIKSVEIARTALNTLALFALCYVLYPAVIDDSLHFDFSAARTEKFMSSYCSTSVLAYLTHKALLDFLLISYKKLLSAAFTKTFLV